MASSDTPPFIQYADLDLMLMSIRRWCVMDAVTKARSLVSADHKSLNTWRVRPRGPGSRAPSQEVGLGFDHLARKKVSA